MRKNSTSACCADLDMLGIHPRPFCCSSPQLTPPEGKDAWWAAAWVGLSKDPRYSVR